MWKIESFGCARGRLGGDFQALTNDVSAVLLQQNVSDRWQWIMGGKDVYSVKGVRQLVEELKTQNSHRQQETFWSSLIPKKINIFGWRLERDRLPVLTKLVEKGIDVPSVLCPRCLEEQETVVHSLLICKRVVNV